MKRLEVRFTRAPDDQRVVGTLAEADRRVYFEYAAPYLETGHSLSPFKLTFAPGLQEHTDRRFGPLPGLFDDSLPDGWGLLLMDRHFGRLDHPLAQIGPLDRLAYLGTRTMGALTYHPPMEPAEIDSRFFNLHDLARNAQELLSGVAAEVLPALLRAGGSPGGARPKVLVGYDPSADTIVSGEAELPPGHEPWIVKFPSRQDEPHAGPVELAYALMAHDAGIDLPETRLFETAAGDHFFGARRFDRDGQRRLHVHTFGNLIHADFRVPSSDYADLLKVTAHLTRNHGDVLRAYRLAAFNVAACNRDDHVKNFAYLLEDGSGDWSLSPAYDLTFSLGPGGEHSLTVAGEGRHPDAEDLARLAAGAGISRRAARAILDEVRAAVNHWPAHADRSGVPVDLRQRIGGALPRLHR